MSHVKKVHFLPHITSDKLTRIYTPRQDIFGRKDLRDLCEYLKSNSSQVNDAFVLIGNIVIEVRSTDAWMTSWQNPHEVLELGVAELLQKRQEESEQLAEPVAA